MERYLLFDAGCAVCHQIAHAIEEAAAGKLKALSIRDPQAREWLEQAYPAGWAHQPYLVTVDGDRVQASAGMGMALRLGRLLGPRNGFRVWNLGRQYGVGWPVDSELSTERRGFLRRAAVFVGSLFFFPRFGPPGGQGQSQGRPRYPFEGIRIKSSRKLEGEEKARAVQQALNSRDVRNVLDETAIEVDSAEAMAVSHELDGGNTLLAIAFPSDQSALAYYQVAQPIDHYATLAWMYVVEDEETARLISASVNGHSVNRTSPANTTLQEECGDCTGIPWTMPCTLCEWFEIPCLIGCCAGCRYVCLYEGLVACVGCVLVICGGVCVQQCCGLGEQDCCVCW